MPYCKEKQDKKWIGVNINCFYEISEKCDAEGFKTMIYNFHIFGDQIISPKSKKKIKIEKIIKINIKQSQFSFYSIKSTHNSAKFWYAESIRD